MDGDALWVKGELRCGPAKATDPVDRLLLRPTAVGYGELRYRDRGESAAPREGGLTNRLCGSSADPFLDDRTDSKPGIIASKLRHAVSVVLESSGNSETNPPLESDIEDHERPSGEPGSKENGSTSVRAAGYGNEWELLVLMIIEFMSVPNGSRPNPKSSN